MVGVILNSQFFRFAVVGAVGFFGTVHPQLDFTSEIISGAFPVFLNLKTRTPSDPLLIVP